MPFIIRRKNTKLLGFIWSKYLIDINESRPGIPNNRG